MYFDRDGNQHDGDPPAGAGFVRDPGGGNYWVSNPAAPPGTIGAQATVAPPPAPPETRDEMETRLNQERRAADDAARQKADADAKAAQAAAIQKLNNHFEYGGHEGGATADAQRYAKIGADAQNRPGAQIDTGRSESYGQQAQGNAAAENRVADLMWKRANGQTPSIASMRADQDMRTLSAAQTSAAAGARGPAALALAQQEAAANTANGTSTISNLAQINSAQERSDAEKAAYGAYSGMRGQDFQGQALEQDNAQKQAQIDAAQKAENDKLQLGMTGAEIDVNKSQLGAQGNQIAIAAGQQTAANNNQTQKDIASDNRSAATTGQIIGAGAGIGGLLLAGALGGGGGGGNGGPPVNENDNNPSNGWQGGGIPDNRGEGGLAGPPGDNSGNNVYGADNVSGKVPVPIPPRGPSDLNPAGLYKPASPPTMASVAPAPAPTFKPTPASTLATAPVNAAGPAPLVPSHPATTTYKPPTMASITSDERLKDGFVEEGSGYTPAGGMSRDSRVLPGPIAPNRVDRFMDGIHPLSYHYKDASQEPRSSPTGGRYLGISAQDLEAVPEVGPQMVSNGPRGKQLEAGPSLSAALAGVARLHERVKDLETQKAGNDASLAAGPSVGGPRPMNAHERALVAQARGMQEGADASLAAGPSVGREPPAWLRQEMEQPAPAFKPFRVTHDDGRTMMITRPGQDFDAGPDASLVRRLLPIDRGSLLRGPSKWDAERDYSNGASSGMSDEQDEHNNPQPYDDDLVEARNAHPLLGHRITSDIRAKGDVQSEGEDRGVINVSEGRFQPPAAERRAASPMTRPSAAPQNRANAESQQAYDRAAHASTLAVPLGYGGTLGSFYATKAEDAYQGDRRAAMARAAAPPPARISAADMLMSTRGDSGAAPTLASVYNAPTADELKSYGATPEEIAAAQRYGGR